MLKEGETRKLEKAGDSQEETECNYELMAIPLPGLSLLRVFLR